MITLNSIDDGRICNCCHSRNNIKEINFEYEANRQGHSIALCAKCRGELIRLLLDDNRVNDTIHGMGEAEG